MKNQTGIKSVAFYQGSQENLVASWTSESAVSGQRLVIVFDEPIEFGPVEPDGVLISQRYDCRTCHNPVTFTTNPTDAGAWAQGAPAMQCLKGLNILAREQVAAQRCPQCMRAAQEFFENV